MAGVFRKMALSTRRLLVPLLLLQLLGMPGGLGEEDSHGPEFTTEPPNQIDFSNTTGAILECAAKGFPVPTVSWVQVDGNPATNVTSLRQALPTGKLVFLPFRAEDYRQDVHAVHYRCLATNTVGSIVSKEVQVRAVLLQLYDVHVYDTYVISGNTGVLKCHIPSVLSDYVKVVSWTRDEGYVISPTHSKDPSEKYVIVANGDLHIRNAKTSDAKSRFRCQTVNRLTGQRKTSASGRIFVTDPKGSVNPRIMDTVPSIRVGQGDILEIPCIAHGNPAPTFQWFVRPERRVQHEVQLGDRAYTTASSLVLLDPQISDGGIYVCEAHNSAGTDKSETAVTVTAPLAVKLEPPVLIADEKKAAAFKCYPSGFPVGSIVWLKNGRHLLTVSHNVSEFSELRVESVDLESRGMYQCVIKNNFETVQATAELRLRDASPVIRRGFAEKVLQPGPGLALQCVVAGSPPPLVTWSLDGIPVTSNRDRVSISSFLDSSGDVVSSLNVSITRNEDGGLYRCQATNKAGQAEHSARINIYGKPAVRKTPKLSVVAGEDVWMHCPMYGYPIDNITWEKDGKNLPFDLRQSLFRNGTVKITNVQKSGDGGRYTCMVKNKHGQGGKEDRNLVVMVPPKIVPFVFPVDQFNVGMRAHITCTLSQGDTPITYQWLKDGSPLAAALGAVTRNIDQHTSSLTIDSVSSRHSGNYSCIVSSMAGSASHSAQLLVQVPPRWVIQPKDVAVVLGGEVTLNCSADGFPTPAITWTKVEGFGEDERKELIHSTSVMQVFLNGSLWLKRAGLEHKGLYFCQATNGIGGGLSTPVKVHVHSPPRFDIKHRNQTVRKGESFEVPCEAKGDGPISIHWMKNGEGRIGQQSDSRYAVKEGPAADSPVSHLHVMAADRSDTAAFTCLAENAFGQDEAIINIVVQEPPDFPTNVSLENVQSRALLLSWVPPFDGNSRITKYVVQYKPSDGNRSGAANWQDKVHEVSVNGKETAAEVNGLNPATTYNIRVLAENMMGISPAGEVVKVVMAEEAPQGPPENVKVEAINPQTLKVTWRPPKREQWNGRIRGYVVGHRTVSTKEAVYNFRKADIVEMAGEDLYTFITDLHKFTQYGVVMQAYNDAGKGPISEEVVSMTSEDVPSKPPQDIRCTTLTSQSIHITWHAPPADGTNGILRGYKILYKPIREWYDDATTQKKTSGQKITLQDLEKFTNYSLQVLGFTKMGDGVLSSPIFCRTLDDVPSQPADIKAIPSSVNAIVVGWRPPAKPNGVLKQYTLYRKIPGQRLENANKFVVPASSLSYEVTGLKKTQRYEFWVSASTSAGEGPISSVVTQTPNGPIVSARVLSFNEQVLTAWKGSVRLTCEAVGSPTPDKKWIINGDHVDQGERIRVLKDGSLQFENIQKGDAGNYTCVVQNGFGDDSVTYAVVVLVPPAAPILDVISTTSTTIEASWSLPDDGGIRIQGYTLNVKREFGQWEQVNLSPDIRGYTLTQLECGTRYHLYLFAFNKVGMGSPSEVLVAATQGTIPHIPPMESVIEESITSVTLNLYAWKQEECVIQYFVVEYRPQGTSDWSFVSNNIKPEQRKLVIPGLLPGTWYDLRMTAHNAAGSNIASFRFATLNVDGGTVEPEVAKIEPVAIPFFSDIRVIIPVVISSVAVFIIIIVMCLCIRRRKGTERRRIKAVPGFPSREHNGISKKHSHQNGKQKGKKHHLKKVDRGSEFTKVGHRTPAPEYDPPPIPGSDDGHLSRIQMLHSVHGSQSSCGSPSFLRSLRSIHPVSVPTAPPMSETSSLAYEPQARRPQESPLSDPRFQRSSGPTRGQQVSRRSGNSAYPNQGFSGPNVITEETTFVFPNSFQDEMNYSEVVDSGRDRRRGPGFDNRHSRAGDPAEVAGLLPRKACF